MSNPEFLYSGLDGLDVAFKACLAQEHIEALETAQAAAREARAPQRCTLGDIEGLVAEMGASGGYAFRFNTGDDGEIWFFARPRRGKDHWGIRVSCSSLGLMVHGYRGMRERLFQRLESFGIAREHLEHSVSRVDVAVDFRCEGLTSLDPKMIVTHSHAKTRAHAEEDQGVWDWMTRGRRCITLTTGKMPGRQVQIYDKRTEAVERRKVWWFDRWGMDPKTDKRPVWRLEVRYGKKYLKERSQITTFDELDSRLANLVSKTLEQIRYTDPADPEPNATRRRLHHCWQPARDYMLGYLQTMSIEITDEALEPKKVRGRRSVIKDTYLSYIGGLAAAYAAAHELTDIGEEYIYHGKIVQEIATALNDFMEADPGGFLKRTARARHKMEISEDFHYVGRIETSRDAVGSRYGSP